MSQSKEEADALAEKLRRYWNNRGMEVSIEVYCVGFKDSQVWGLRSNMKNGVPTNNGEIFNPHKALPRVRVSNITLSLLEKNKAMVLSSMLTLSTLCHPNQIVRRSGLPYMEVMTTLFSLEKDRKVISVGRGTSRKWQLIKKRA